MYLLCLDYFLFVSSINNISTIEIYYSIYRLSDICLQSWSYFLMIQLSLKLCNQFVLQTSMNFYSSKPRFFEEIVNDYNNKIIFVIDNRDNNTCPSYITIIPIISSTY